MLLSDYNPATGIQRLIEDTSLTASSSLLSVIEKLTNTYPEEIVRLERGTEISAI